MLVIKRNILKMVSLILISFLMVACSSGGSSNSTTSESSDETVSGEEATRPAGWTEATHSNDADPDYSIVFPDDTVGRIDLSITNSNWQMMMTDENIVSVYGEFGAGSSMQPGRPGGGIDNTGTTIENPAWMPCTFSFNGISWNYVGVRFKGNSSLRDAWQSGNYKIPFRFDFDEFEDTYPAIDDQRFYGFKKLTLSSGYKDDSLIREKVTADIFRTLGVAAPRTSFYRLFIDCGDGAGAKYFGLYTMVEVPGDPMLNEQFGNEDGNLYKPDGTTASFGAGTLSEDDFDKESNEDEADFSDVNSLYTAINASTSDSETWKTTLESTLDVDGFLNWLAVNTLIQNWDTYGNMTHNYYLYNDGDLLTWIPWDNNEALKDSGTASGNPLSLELNESSLTSWPLISKIIAQSSYLAIYQANLETAVNDYFNATTMQTIYQNAHNLIYDYAVDEQAGYTNLSSESAFINSLNYLNTHVEDRVTAVEDYLNP